MKLMMRMKGIINPLKKYLPIFLLLIVLSSCSSRNSSLLLKYPKSFRTDTLKTVLVNNPKNTYPEYRIRNFDMISIRNLQDPELLGSRVGPIGELKNNYKVGKDGMLTLPVLGDVLVTGLTAEEAKIKIQQLYTAKLFKDPIIELSINSLEVTLLGAFKTEGNLKLDNDNMDLIDVIGKSGGFTDDANIKKIRIIRGDRKNPELIVLNLSNVNTLGNSKLKMQDGDIIIAEKSKYSTFLKNATGFNTIASIGILILNTYVVILSLKK